MAPRAIKVGVAKSPHVRTVTVPPIPSGPAVDVLSELNEAFPPKDPSLSAHMVTKTSKYGYRGLSYLGDNRRKRWAAYIRVGSGQRKHLGCYHTKEEAARAYDRAAKILYGNNAVLNFPNETYKIHKAHLERNLGISL